MEDPLARYFIGTSGWTYGHWRGNFYPADLPKSRWFGHYITQFNAVEVNATFYRTFKDQVYHNWRARSPAGFRFVLKAPRTITHYKYLVDAAGEIQAFDRSAHLLEEKLGLILLQVAPGTPYDLGRLRDALQAFSDPSKVAVEFRHESWLSEETRRLLSEVGSAYCNADSPRKPLASWLTSGAGYLRLHGRKHWYASDYTPEELSEIAGMARQMVAGGADQVYIFFNNDFEGYAPKNALALLAMLKIPE
jgi:uncharacterized protein YecE (DUF72 family)